MPVLVTGRLQLIARERKVGPFLRYSIGTAPATAAVGPEGSGQTASIQTAGTACRCDVRSFLPPAGGNRTHTTADAYARSTPETISYRSW